MPKQKNIPFDNVSRQKKIAVVAGTFIFLFGGMFASIVAIDNFKNYYNPYLFGFTFGSLGLVTGLIVARKIKPYVILNAIMLTNYSNVTIMFSMGFIGNFMLGGQILNSELSHLYKCDNFIVVDKEFHKEGYKRVEKNILVIDVENNNQRLLCGHDYWRTIGIGQTVNACIYKSPIGFDYLTLPDDK